MNDFDPIAAPRPQAPRKAVDVCRLFKLRPEARELLTADLTPKAYFEALLAADHLADARRLLAHTLRPESAVWWAILCLEHSRKEKGFDNDHEQAAFDAVGHWLVGPSETNRRAAESAGWKARPTTAAGILALAAFLSGGSISRPGLPTVLPARHVCGRLCGVVVYLASVRFDPGRYKQYLRQYLAIGADVAAGVNPPPVRLPDHPPAEPASKYVALGMDQLPAEFRALFGSGPTALESPANERLFLGIPPTQSGTERSS